jgi:hypothetical protein
MRKTKFSVEFSHIYTNEAFSDEHKQSIQNLKKYLPKLKDDDFQTCVFIDNYNSTEDLLDVDDFLENLKNEGVQPDYYAFEADMAKYTDRLLATIQDERLRKSYERYITKRNVLPCSFMTAIWYLIRLGVFEKDVIVQNGKNGKKVAPAERIINILPERFRAVEAKTLEIINSTKNTDAIGRVDYVFYSSSNSNGPTL